MTDKESLLSEAEKLAHMLVLRPEVEAYREAEAKMNNRPDVVASLRRLREIQEQILEFSERNVPEVHYQHLVRQVETLSTELMSIPEVEAFTKAQEEVDQLIQTVTGRLRAALDLSAN